MFFILKFLFNIFKVLYIIFLYIIYNLLYFIFLHIIYKIIFKNLYKFLNCNNKNNFIYNDSDLKKTSKFMYIMLSLYKNNLYKNFFLIKFIKFLKEINFKIKKFIKDILFLSNNNNELKSLNYFLIWKNLKHINLFINKNNIILMLKDLSIIYNYIKLNNILSIIFIVNYNRKNKLKFYLLKSNLYNNYISNFNTNIIAANNLNFKNKYINKINNIIVNYKKQINYINNLNKKINLNLFKLLNYNINFSSTNISKYCNNIFINNISILYIRKNKVFNKGRYSRNRQTYRTGVYWCLYINIIAVILFYFWFYKFSINFGYIWWLFYFLILLTFFSRSLKFKLYNLKNIINEFFLNFLWLSNLIFDILYKLVVNIIDLIYNILSYNYNTKLINYIIINIKNFINFLNDTNDYLLENLYIQYIEFINKYL